MMNPPNCSAMYSSDDDDDSNYQNYLNYLNYPFWNMSNITDCDYPSDWCDAGEQEFTIKMFQTCVFCLIFPLGVMGNCLVITTFALYRRLRLRSMTDVFLFHLALADLLLLLTVPLQAVDTNLGWIFSVPLCKATRACHAINTYSGLMLLACISVDRYMLVARAQDALRLRNQILTAGKIAAVSVWFVAVLLSLPEILFSGVLGSGTEAYCGMLADRNVKLVSNGAIITVFCLSFSVMVTCYSWIAQALRRGKQRHQRHQQRTLKLMLVLVLVFLLFQLPYTVVLSYKMAGQFCSLLLEYITCTLAYTRCCLNPILYALVGVRFRNDVQRLMHNLGCACECHQVPQSLTSTSISPSSPAHTAFSPTSPKRSNSSN